MAEEPDENPDTTINNPFDGREDSPRRKAALRLTVIARMLRTNFDRKVATLNVTRSQWSMITTVARSPGATQRTIAENLEMSEASAGRLIDRLCGEGLLERRDRSDDRRVRAVYLSQQARPLLDQLGIIAGQSENRMFAGFADEEVDALLGYLARLYDNVSRG